MVRSHVPRLRATVGSYGVGVSLERGSLVREPVTAMVVHEPTPSLSTNLLAVGPWTTMEVTGSPTSKVNVKGAGWASKMTLK